MRKKPRTARRLSAPDGSLLTVADGLELAVLIAPGHDVLRHHARQPATRVNRGTEAVLRSTPTALRSLLLLHPVCVPAASG